MKRPRRRSILRMIALLLAWWIAGATLNVAVAWGCVAVWRSGPGVSSYLLSQYVYNATGQLQWIVSYSHSDSAGWPMLSMSWPPNKHPFETTVSNMANPEWNQAAIPLIPRWPGFAVNTLFYAGVLWMLFCGPFALRRMIRRRRGRCPACAYPIGQSPVCTECGAAVSVSPSVLLVF